MREQGKDKGMGVARRKRQPSIAGQLVFRRLGDGGSSARGCLGVASTPKAAAAPGTPVAVASVPMVAAARRALAWSYWAWMGQLARPWSGDEHVKQRPSAVALARRAAQAAFLAAAQLFADRSVHRGGAGPSRVGGGSLGDGDHRGDEGFSLVGRGRRRRCSAALSRPLPVLQVDPIVEIGHLLKSLGGRVELDAEYVPDLVGP